MYDEKDMAIAGGSLMLFGFFIGMIIHLSYYIESHTEKDIVENTSACFYLDNDYKRQFSWECEE